MDLIKICHKIITYSFYALFFLVPIVFTGNTSELFEFNKMWITFGLTVVVMAAWGTKMILEKQFRVQKTPLDWFLLAFLLSQVISSLFSLDSRISLWGYYSRFNGGLLSMLSYVFLYYAFVTNVLHDDTTEPKKDTRSLPARVILFIVGLALPLLAVFFVSPITAANDWTIFLLLFVLLVSLGLFIASFPKPPLQRMLSITLTSAFIVALWGFPSHFGSDPTCYVFRGTFDVTCWTDAFKPTIRIFSTLGQPAWLSAYLAALIPVTIAKLLQTLHKRKDQAELFSLVIYSGLSILFYACLLYTNTRAGFLAFWAGNAVFWMIAWLTKYLPVKKFVQLFFLVNIVFFVMNFFIGTPIQQLDRISLRGLTAHTESAEQASAPTTPAKNAAPVYETNITNSADIRLYVWQGAIDAWKDNFLFGTGVETFAFAYYKYRPVGHNLTSEWDYLYNKAHNEYVNYLATTGLVGIGTYAAFILMFCYLMVHGLLRRFIPKFAQAKQTHEPSTAYDASYTIVVIGLFSGWVTILVSNFFGFSVVIINILFFLFPAFALLFGNLLPAYTYRFPKEQGKVSHVTVSQWFSVAVVALFAAYSLFFLLRFWDADKAYALGSNLEHAGELATAYPSLQQAVNLLPSEPVFKDELSYTSAQLAVQLYQQQASASAATAASLATQALSLSDEVLSEHPNNIVFWKTRIRIFYALSQLDQRYLPYAIKAAEKASELAPTDAKIQWNLGVLYGQNGQSDKALATLQKTIALKPDYVDAYYALGLFYHDAGVDATTGKIKDQAMADKGIETMEHILTKMDSNNEQAKKALESWKN